MQMRTTTNGEVRQFSTELAGRPLTVEVGKVAQQTNGSCTVRYGDTVVLATAVMSTTPREGIDYFPLLVDYEERLYAAGKIKGSRWVKREGRPSDEVILTGRLIDRSIRPLFPKAIKNDVQVIATVQCFDGENDSDIVGLIAASTALAISSIPWEGPIGGARIGRIPREGSSGEYEWVLNPSFEARAKSDLDLVIAGTADRVLMVEAGAQQVPDAVIPQAVEFALPHLGALSNFIREVAAAVGKPKIAPSTVGVTLEPEHEKFTLEWVREHATESLFSSKLPTKHSRKAVVAELENQFEAELVAKSISKEQRKLALERFNTAVEGLISQAIIDKSTRVDGRKLTQVRPLGVEVGTLPRTHGSGLFTRGETQVLSVVTLGAPGDEQFLEGIEGNAKKRYIHHYNFPPYSVGEVGPIRSAGRREIGHGALAERALMPVLPPREDFPYTIRVVSEVLSSNGSSSMASTCGSTLALMDAGVPIKTHVAGVAMGLATNEQGDYKIITDLQDLEDGPGGMDFKVTGTHAGLTAIQMDTKTKGLTIDMVRDAIAQSRGALNEIIASMSMALSQPRAEMSPYAPRIITVMINPERIRDVIGPGGKIINEIIDDTGCQIDIEPDGRVMITGTNEASTAKAVEWVKNLTREVKVGEVFQGKVVRIMDFGAFVSITPNQDGMVHISELAPHRVETVGDVVKIGDTVTVKVVEIDGMGRINLSMRALQETEQQHTERLERSRAERPMRPRSGGHGGPRRSRF